VGGGGGRVGLLLLGCVGKCMAEAMSGVAQEGPEGKPGCSTVVIGREHLPCPSPAPRAN